LQKFNIYLKNSIIDIHSYLLVDKVAMQPTIFQFKLSTTTYNDTNRLFRWINEAEVKLYFFSQEGVMFTNMKELLF